MPRPARSRLLRTTAALALAALALPAAALAHTPVPRSELASTWRVEPLVLAFAGLALVLFAQAFVRLRRRGRADHAPWTRVPMFAAAVAIGTLALVSPLDPAGDQYLISAHMLQHVLIGDLAPALAMLAVRGPLVLFLLPPFVLRPLARVGWLRGGLSFLLRPLVAVVAWAAAMAFWHVPAVYDYALTHRNVHDLEHLCFLVAGTLVWAQLIDPARRGELRLTQRLGLAGLLFAFGTILSDVLIFSFHPLYPAYAAQPERLFGLEPVRDQQAAGLVMMGEQLLTLGLCAALLLRAYTRARPTRTPRAAEART